ncbi:MAG: PAS domain-containing protein [Desulfobacterales bacterium]|nr:PAS domain-containing protein [Desulfobacterales bacterium]
MRTASKAIIVQTCLSRHPSLLWDEDFSEIKRRFDSLRKSEVEDLRKALQEAPREVLSLARMVKVVRVNRATLDLFEAKGVEEFREGLSVIFSKESYDVFKEELISFWKGKHLFCSEATNRTLSGENKDILIRVAIPTGFEESWSRVYVAITDVTNLKGGMQGLRAAADMYRKVFACAYTPMLIADYDSGVIVEVNEGAGRLLGLANSEVVGRHFTELFSPEGRDWAVPSLKDTAERTFFQPEASTCSTEAAGGCPFQ